MSLPYTGPHVVLTPVEVQRVHQALKAEADDVARAVTAKTTAAVNADRRFLEPSP